MTIDEAKDIIRKHIKGKDANVRKFLDAMAIAKEQDKSIVTIDDLYNWALDVK